MSRIRLLNRNLPTRVSFARTFARYSRPSNRIDENEEIFVGDYVLIEDNKKGVVRYKGETSFAGKYEILYGIELDHGDFLVEFPTSHMPQWSKAGDGWEYGRQYFSCRPGHGVLVHRSNIVEKLPHNRNIVFDFENCDVIDWSIFDEVDDAHLEYIQDSLETGAPLNLIDFTDMEVKELSKALKVSKVLHRVNLDCSQITDCGANYLGEVLKEESSVLTELMLRENMIGDHGLEYLSKALLHNSSLQELGLELNPLTDTGVYHLAESLKHNSSLIMLDLSGVKVSDVGAWYIAEALKHNTSLERLNFSENFLSEAAYGYFTEALKVNTSLKSLWLNKGNAELEEVRDGIYYHPTKSRYIGLDED